MQKKKIAETLIFCLMVSGAGSVPSANAVVNVKDFGAKGDNSTDDTEAIRAAIAAAGKTNKLGRAPSWGGMYPVYPEIVFPSGRYLISEPIDVHTVGTIRGQGHACIIQKNQDQDIFTSSGAWRVTISGLTFVGGRNQLYLGNPNDSGGFIIVEKCYFLAATGTAVTFPKDTCSTLAIIRDCMIRCERQALVTYCDQTKMMDSWIIAGYKL